MRGWAAVAAIVLGILAAREGLAQDVDDVRLEPAFVGQVRGRLGVLTALGHGSPRVGAEGGGRLDVVAVDARDLQAFVGRAEVSANTVGSGAFGAQFAAVDYAIVEGHSTLGNDGQRVVQPCLWLLNAPCTSGGHFGAAADLLAWQASLDSGRRAWRLAELDAVASIEATTSPGWLERRLPIRAGVSIDEVDCIPGVAAKWIPRLDVGADAHLRLAGGKVQLDPRLRYRPSLTDFSGDFGVEATLYLGYRARYDALQPQGAPLLVGLEFGYAYWSNPSHAFGVSWDDVAPSTLFVRAVLEPTIWAVH